MEGLLLWLLSVILMAGLLLLPGCGKKEEAPAADTSVRSTLEITDRTETEEASGASEIEDAAGLSETSAAEDAELSGTEVTRTASGETAPDSAEEVGKGTEKDLSGQETGGNLSEQKLDENGSYTSKEEVALYIHLYGHLPSNYITKKQAEKLGWDSHAGNLQDVAPGKSIGGSHFGNYEGLLPDAKGRNYYECDINYEGGYRGAERIIYSDDGLVFYTADHYKSFEQLY